ncbi:cell division protein ZapA [Roseibium hamelinense]|uniref:Cell division protein ZapA n=1 Tax=Roseibium hamelinense TaxID=150831 RepID=A0A562SNJ0_9HYPH|nr:cell division protein ZapA [Roseibium hamelinense]MTI44975.1 cell division protein ZapA [Roseibium hamelinense]TWI82236.1 cell division protein ZapA [Roseibium hamelinense]
MAQISVTINGRSFRMACDDGEEERLEGLAERFDGWISELRGAFGEIGDQRLTVMAGIMATDQLSELEKKVERLEAELETAQSQRLEALEYSAVQEAEVAGAINDIASQIEGLANGLSASIKPT